ncbi:MAG TPA: glucoamylase family protein [Candidatus Sulfotelmatobacter sp.]|nr:glucoamylase family protein [Candidatus Sulfotelmatobacter sp.]
MCGAYLSLAPFASLLSCSSGSQSSKGSTVTPFQGTDTELLDDLQRGSFQFFWNETNPATGQVKDRAFLNGNDTRTMSSIAATGFGLTALCIGDSRGYAKTADITTRVRNTLQFLYQQMPNVHGFYYHFVDMNTGQRWAQCELSSIDTSLLLCGVLTARQYFQDAMIQDLAAKIYARVDWPWMMNGGPTFSMGWMPESGFLSARWEHYCELMMIYLLGIGSTTNPVSADSWKAWTRPTINYQGLTYISGNDPIFTHQYSQAWFDFRNKKDAYTNYFDNSITATKAHKLFCLSLKSRFSDYSDDLWGISASDYVKGYTAWGGPPPQGPLDGSIVPCATGGSLPFLPTDCLRVLRTIRGAYGTKAWGKYSYVDAFNPLTGWYDTDVLGIDLGITMVMAENYRTGLVWNTFMKNPEPQSAMQKVGFHTT